MKIFLPDEWNKGQTLIEIVLALGVIVLVILALVLVTTSSISNAEFAKNQAQATKYAQEGIEKVRAYRDQNSWLGFVVDCFTILDSEPPPPSPFTRTLACYQPGAPPRVDCIIDENCEIEVKVVWSDGKGEHESKLTTLMTDWR